MKETYTKGIKMNNMKLKQLSVFLQNKKGSLYDALETLSENDINIRALSLADTSDFGILRVVVDNPQKGEKVLEENYLVKTTDIVAIEMTDSPGGLSFVLKTIKENNLDLEYLYAFTHDKKDKAILLLHTDNLDALIDALNKNEIVIVPPEEVYNL
jgi:hypothetical protein